MKKLQTINVGFMSNAFARGIIEEYTNGGWGIDSIVEDSRRDTWITFYKYKKKKSKTTSADLIPR